jgi:hypothetical protein
MNFWTTDCGTDAQLLAADAMLLGEFLLRENAAGRSALVLGRAPAAEAIVHGQFHQKAFAAMKPTAEVIGWIPGVTAPALHVARVLQPALGGAP